jgi:hypothetical protein
VPHIYNVEASNCKKNLIARRRNKKIYGALNNGIAISGYLPINSAPPAKLRAVFLIVVERLTPGNSNRGMPKVSIHYIRV